ncbi:hypothetical protein SAMN04487843_12327 [Methylobacterium sp. ap11]|uniref:hypothetical protein n=1 Tax=Methylobacterium sp. ap11 TaxID=1761799 RepID=UPI0008C98704|nr:hypothetical protein [Methylobacterium sp. ap11]SEP46213.1 hypothetical protein SAMN04487843_12327 [Methylobacterium sp. ap11]
MSSFDTLQSRFVDRELQASGLAGAAILQPAALLAAGDDAALWTWFDAIPQPGPVYAPAGPDFFSAYAAVIGALVPSGGPLDPIAAAQARLAAWGTAPPTWSVGAAGLSRALAAAPGLTFDFAEAAAPGPGYWGLVGGAPRGPDAIFAGGTVRAKVAWDHGLAFAPQPGDWYVSSALSLAYRMPGKAPWNPDAAVTWDTAFGPGGTLERMTAGLLVVSGLAVSASSDAPFDAASQALVRAGAAVAGIWPYHLPASAATTTVAFDAAGCLRLTVAGKPKAAIAVAAIVQDAAGYLGL